MALSTALNLLQESLALPPGTREAFLRERCGDDVELLTKTLSLLAAHGASEGFLEPPASPAAPQALGPYRLITPLGAGGMGQVWLAERDDGAFQQRVAIKIFAGALGDADSLRRAERERQFLAWLDHPHIARVLDGGSTAAGQPYVVMEFVDGRRIDDYCREAALGLEARITLFLQVAAAVDAAHRALIIHRDIKPANILVDAQGQARLLDFGIAKSLDERGAGLTAAGLLPLTPQYASPEQLLGQPLTTACDIYALGLLLDELLTGAPLRRELAPAQLIAAAQQPPPASSTRVDAVALGLSATAAREWRRRCAGDLDRVLRKALAPEPAQRYESARALADDLQRWLQHRPVLARVGGAGYRLGKFLRRHRLSAAAVMLGAAVLVLASGLAWRESRRAAREGERALRANEFLAGMIGNANPYTGGKPLLLVDALDRAAATVAQQLDGEPALEADVRRAIGDAYLALERNDAAREQLDRAALLRRAEGGDGYARVLSSQAQLQWRLGDYAATEQLYRQALPHCGGDARGQLLRSELLNDLAALLNDTGRYAEALPLARQALALKDSWPGALGKDRFVNLSNMANALDGLGRYSESRDVYEQALALAATLQPLPELDLAIALNNYAYLQDEMGLLQQAVASQERAVALTRRVMGADYPRLAMQQSNLAQRYARVGRHADAAAAMAEALRLAPAAISADDQRLGHLLNSAARVALARGDAAEAAARATQALAVYDRAATVEDGRREKATALLDEARHMQQREKTTTPQ
jgi:eukaryotic-like serine/threonine-protein kinase